MALKVKQQQPFLRKIREVMAMLDDMTEHLDDFEEKVDEYVENGKFKSDTEEELALQLLDDLRNLVEQLSEIEVPEIE